MATYSYSGRPRFVTVAADGLYQIDAFGGQGGSYEGGARGNVAKPGTGGLGAESSGTVALTAGEKLEIVVGGAGAEGSGPGGGGGGGSFVLANVAGKYVPLIVAGGGGGAFYNDGHGGMNTPGSGNGGAGYYAAGGGGAGVKSNGGTSSSRSAGFGSAGGGSNGTGNYAGGVYTPPRVQGQFRTGGNGGFGGGGAGGAFGGGGGGGYSGGHGGYGGEAIGEYSGYAAGGGSFAAATAITPTTRAGINDGNGRVTITPVCFATGTRIRIVRDDGRMDDRVVERLEIGDIVVTSSGQTRAIRWIGQRSLVFHDDGRKPEASPIRISAHALGSNRPSRDLRVSPGHGICVDLCGEVLIPAGALVNGSTILQEDVDTVTYWHVELEGGHDIILAENLPCESYLEMGNRSFFAEAEATALHAVPDALAITDADFCRPFHHDGPVVSFVRERLAAHAPDLGWTLREVPLADLHLLVDGRRVDAETSNLRARFLVPADAEEVWLVSDTGVPAEIGVAPDLRRLGVCVGSLVIDDGFGTPRTIAANHPLLAVGFHAIEDGPQRWTAGRARLPAALWEGCRGGFFLRVDLTRQALPRWAATAAAIHPSKIACRGGLPEPPQIRSGSGSWPDRARASPLEAARRPLAQNTAWSPRSTEASPRTSRA